MTTSVIRRLAASQPWLDSVGDAVQPRLREVLGSRPACGTRSTAGGSALLCTRC